MEKKYMESKPGTFTPYYEAAEALKRKLAVLERVVPLARIGPSWPGHPGQECPLQQP